MILAISADQMKKIDELAISKYGIILEEMMELAGFHLASLARRALNGSLLTKNVVVLVGKGNNGGGGLVAARYLCNWGAQVTVILLQKDCLSKTVLARLQTLKALNEKIIFFVPKMKLFKMFNDSEIVIDALLGYSVKSDPRYSLSEIINQANSVETPVLSLDIPSGLDATTGKIYNPCMIAEKTLTLALPKKGLLIKEARDYIGDLYLADIGISPILYQEIGIEIDNIFNKKSVIQIY